MSPFGRRINGGRRLLAPLLGMILAQMAGTALAQERSGGWSAEGVPWTLSQKGRPAVSRPYMSEDAPPAGAKIDTLYWRYRFASPPPRGLEVALCSALRCVPLRGGRGMTLAMAGDPAANPLYISVFLPGKGAIKPPVRMLRTQVIVNYRYPGP